MKTLHYALLGLLARQAASGYDLTHQINGIAVFWNAGHNHIYPALAQLEETGLISHQVIEQDKRPNKKIYILEQAGREALQKWVLEPVELGHPRDEFLLKTYSMWLVEPEQLVSMIRVQAAIRHQRAREYEEKLASVLTLSNNLLPDLRSPHFGTYALIKRGLSYEQSYAEWCDWLIQQLTQEDLNKG